MKIYTFRNTKNMFLQAFSSQTDPHILPKTEKGNWKLLKSYEKEELLEKELKELIPDINFTQILKEINQNKYSIGQFKWKWEEEKA